MQTKRVGEVRLPYALCSAPAELDDAVLKLTALADKLLHLAEVEKTCNMLADEIEKKPPQGQRVGIRHDPAVAGNDKVYFNETRRERARGDSAVDESKRQHLNFA